jgi:hypothetical protein
MTVIRMRHFVHFDEVYDRHTPTPQALSDPLARLSPGEPQGAVRRGISRGAMQLPDVC